MQRTKVDWGCGPAIECLPSLHKTLSSDLSIAPSANIVFAIKDMQNGHFTWSLESALQTEKLDSLLMLTSLILLLSLLSASFKTQNYITPESI